MHAEPSTTDTPLSHVLQGGYAHPLARTLQVSRVQVDGVLAERALTKDMLMFPLFVSDNPDAKEPIDSFPNQYRLGINVLEPFLKPLVEKGLRSVMLFGVPTQCQKDARGTPADDPNGPTISAIRMMKREFPGLFVAADVCLCEYTDHGHCGYAEGGAGGEIDTALSVARIAEVALSYARAGADCVAPSDMMDGRVGAIKKALITNRLANRCCLMSYSAKFASALYGPFRAAACSAPSSGDRKGYQLPPNARGLAKRAIVSMTFSRLMGGVNSSDLWRLTHMDHLLATKLRDISEGADIIMVKPAQTYLDVLSEARSVAPSHPLACYQVSGEYAALLAGADAGVYDLKPMVLETLDCMLRAGATLILTYFTPMLLDWL
ncbi:delta-aminolevulinic acid dehydratase [Puccinia sorghi]|uniref:Delta-aminolevulinic acid dehydratase n=1 Tax=Puccinia sorghi TaxID=27349 RepID=A0A0L6UUI3_9BASI|nr:delta-aminolevulinic acid dehydratase [Puccinia sorghi]